MSRDQAGTPTHLARPLAVLGNGWTDHFSDPELKHSSHAHWAAEPFCRLNPRQSPVIRTYPASSSVREARAWKSAHCRHFAAAHSLTASRFTRERSLVRN